MENNSANQKQLKGIIQTITDEIIEQERGKEEAIIKRAMKIKEETDKLREAILAYEKEMDKVTK